MLAISISGRIHGGADKEIREQVEKNLTHDWFVDITLEDPGDNGSRPSSVDAQFMGDNIGEKVFV